MKAIPQNNAGPQWSNKLFEDLAFIKQHLRYPLSKKTIPSAILIFVFLYLGFRVAMLTLLLNKRSGTMATWFISVMLVLILVSIVLRYWRTLRFRSIATPFSANENMKLVDEFLRSQQLNVYRHPQAPEVLQIVSIPIGNTEQREVMIFIADDKRVLINSHFINQKWTISQQSSYAGKMAYRLKEWLVIHYPNTNTGVMAQ